MEMQISYDIDELDATEHNFADDSADDYGSEYDSEREGLSFADIDFVALGIDPTKPTTAKPGSEEKVLMLAARYAAGVPLWHNRDCYDHGPGEMMARLLRQAPNQPN
jgi:hypothetical protein